MNRYGMSYRVVLYRYADKTWSYDGPLHATVERAEQYAERAITQPGAYVIIGWLSIPRWNSKSYTSHGQPFDVLTGVPTP